MPKIVLIEAARMRTRGFAFERGVIADVPQETYDSLIEDNRFEDGERYARRHGHGRSGDTAYREEERRNPTVKMSEVFGSNGANAHQTAAGSEVAEADERSDELLNGQGPDGKNPIIVQPSDGRGVVTGMDSLGKNSQGGDLAGINPAPDMAVSRQEIVPQSQINAGEAPGNPDGRKEIHSEADLSSGASRPVPTDPVKRRDDIKAAVDLLDIDDDDAYDDNGRPSVQGLAKVLGWTPTQEDVDAATPPPPPTTKETQDARGGQPNKGLRIRRQVNGTRSQNTSEPLDTGAAAADGKGDTSTAEAVEV